MFEELKEAIKANDNQDEPTMSNWWGLIADLENLVPPVMHYPKWKGYVKKAARILFFREVCENDTITSTKDLTSGALWKIHKFLNDDEFGIENCQQVTNWYEQNAQEIYNYAPFVKSAKLKSDKVRRDRKKKSKETPF
jgi:hypothetical protein